MRESPKPPRVKTILLAAESGGAEISVFCGFESLSDFDWRALPDGVGEAPLEFTVCCSPDEKTSVETANTVAKLSTKTARTVKLNREKIFLFRDDMANSPNENSYL